MGTSIHVTEEARDSLRLFKWMSGSEDYSEALTTLMNEAGYDVPEGGLTEEDMKERLFGA